MFPATTGSGCELLLTGPVNTESFKFDSHTYTSTGFGGLNQQEGLDFTDVVNTGFQDVFFVCAFGSNVDYNV